MLSLDEFATRAMQTILANALASGEYFDVDDIAERSYLMADAMSRKSPDWAENRALTESMHRRMDTGGSQSYED